MRLSAAECAPAAPRLSAERTLTGRRKTQALVFPLPLPPKVAILVAGFECGRSLRAFSPEDPSLLAWGPDAMVMSLRLALQLADAKSRGSVALPELSVALVVLTSMADGLLGESRRDQLWRAFRVPLFEQLCAADGTVMARECEVHHGLHLDPEADQSPAGEILKGCCECGAETPRLMNLATPRFGMAAVTGGRR